jgi:enamine deaminase RidA (YjgF/YER057c/UK114 family)
VRYGDLIFTAGMTPRRDGVLLYQGPVTAGADPEQYRDALVLSCANAMAAARTQVLEGETLAKVLSMTVYIAAESNFVAHSKLADFASEFLEAELGENGICARAAVGVATLPGNAVVEVQIIACL